VEEGLVSVMTVLAFVSGCKTRPFCLFPVMVGYLWEIFFVSVYDYALFRRVWTLDMHAFFDASPLVVVLLHCPCIISPG
jgi:hypothetical protein